MYKKLLALAAWQRRAQGTDPGGGGVTIRNQNKTVTENGTYKADSGYTGLGNVTVNVPDPVLEELTITENGEYSPDNGVDGFSKVIANIATSGGVKKASGTVMPTADSQFLKVTGIGFTPKMFKILVSAGERLDGVAKSHGTIYVNGDGVVIGTNAAGTSYNTSVFYDQNTTPFPDTINNYQDSANHGILETGFFSWGTKYWKAGYTYEWEAWG